MEQHSPLNWFESWFDSPYYHILYKDRDQKEAELFIDNLIQFLHPEKDVQFLDLACGKGRHAVYLNKKGFPTIGIDLSPESIAFASQFENDSLQFYVQDMRKPFRINYFDYVLNLFTSFGYFEHEKDDLAVINSIHKMLKKQGMVIIDFMNVTCVQEKIVPTEEKIVNGISFEITKTIENNFIVKHIRFTDKGTTYNYEEKVKLLRLSDFERYLSTANLKIVNLFGNYQLQPFDSCSSERLIIVAQKN
ncbi:MAG TPA: class I SAM-dependent methyltransferase [Bacteroidia bacterium]|jgi:SAM-dependent methyltransferase|nr:class I SAM-dependent methyltransferase [Bacteroidia bacterium]HRG52416.1 class I SAM-dependent methyltransferase [Bacteroidia bacterium]